MKIPVLIALVFGLPALAARADSIVVPDRASGVLSKVRPSGAVSDWLTGLNQPEHVVLTANGDALVAEGGSGKVWRYSLAGGAPVQVGADLPDVVALAVSGEHVFALSNEARRVFLLNADGSAFVAHGPELAGPGAELTAMAVSLRGEVLVVNRSGDAIMRVAKQGQSLAVTTFASSLVSPYGLAYNASGKLHASDAGAGGRVLVFKNNGMVDGVVASELGAGLRGLCFDSNDDLFFLRDNAGDGELRKLSGGAGLLVAAELGDVSTPTARNAKPVVVARQGQVLAAPESAVLSRLGTPAIGGGVVTFKSSLLSGPGGINLSNNHGIWKSTGGTLELVAQRGADLPAGGGVKYRLIQDPVVNGNGRIAFLSSLQLGGTTTANNWALLSDAHQSGQLTLLLRKGDGAPVNPDNPGVVEDPLIKFSAIRKMVLADDAGPLVLASISGPGVNSRNNQGLWSIAHDGTISLVIRKGVLLVCADGITRRLAALEVFKPATMTQGQSRHVSDMQEIVFRGRFADGHRALLKAAPGGAPELLDERKGGVGVAVPNAVFGSFGPPASGSAAADFVFRAKMAPAPGTSEITSANAWALFAQDINGVNTLLARASFGGTGVAEAVFSSLADPVMCKSGGYAFWGKMKTGFGGVTSGTSAALWEDTGMGLALVARQGGVQVPGILGAVKFTSFTRMVLPQTGGVVFTAKVSGQGISTANNNGLWAHDGAGGVELLLRKGDSVQVNGQPKKVSAITIFKAPSMLSGQSRHFDDDGTVCALTRFTDGSSAILLIAQP